MSESSANLETEDRATARRAMNFSAEHWLKAKKFIDEDNAASIDPTSWHPRVTTNFSFVAPALSNPKVEGFKSEQEFEGHVIEVDVANDSFWARLIDISGMGPDEDVEFDLNEVPEDDWKLIVPGALFSWNIGLEIRDRQVRRVAEIRFRRFFKFSKETISKAEQRADELYNLIGEINHNERTTSSA